MIRSAELIPSNMKTKVKIRTVALVTGAALGGVRDRTVVVVRTNEHELPLSGSRVGYTFSFILLRFQSFLPG